MKSVVKILAAVIIVAILLFIISLTLAIQGEPQINRHQPLSFDNVKQVKILADKILPSHKWRRQVKNISMTEQDLNLLAGYGLSQVLKRETVFAEIKLSDDYATIYTTLTIPPTPFGRFINLSFELEADEVLFKVRSCDIGSIKLPGIIINPIISFIHREFLKIDSYAVLMDNTDSIKKVTIKNHKLSVVYKWDLHTLARLQKCSKELFLPRIHQKRLVFYNNELSLFLRPRTGKQISLADVLVPMFKIAEKQSQISGDPVMENTALLQILAMHSTRTRLYAFLDRDLRKGFKPFVWAYLTLNGRRDLAQHFLVSAGLTVSGGTRFANFMGLVKEVEDSDRGTGFSFADLAADKAGVKFGEMAAGSEKIAENFFGEIIKVSRERDFMPSIHRLPEGIMELEFKKRYKDLDSESYFLVNQEIALRVSKCSLFK